MHMIHLKTAGSCLCFAVFSPMNSAEETINASLFDKCAGYRVRNPVTSFILSSGHFSECCVGCLKYQNCNSINIHIYEFYDVCMYYPKEAMSLF